MFNKLIREYVNHLKENDIKTFAFKNGVELRNEEITIIYNYIKNDWKTIVYGNPRNIFMELKKSINGDTYKKIENLYYEFKRKYIDYL